MTKNELLDIVTVIVMSYPDRFKEDNIQGMVTAWYAFFKDDNAKAVELAVTKHISVNKWPPSIAEIRSNMVDILHPELIPPDVAWASVVDVLYSGSYFGSGSQFNFPPMIQRVIDTIGWHTLRELHRGSNGQQKDGFDRVAFMDLYRPAYERARENAGMPQALQAAMEKASRLSPETTTYLESTMQARKEQDETWKRIMKRSYDEIDAPKSNKLLGEKI